MTLGKDVNLQSQVLTLLFCCFFLVLPTAELSISDFLSNFDHFLTGPQFEFGPKNLYFTFWLQIQSSILNILNQVVPKSEWKPHFCKFVD